MGKKNKINKNKFKYLNDNDENDEDYNIDNKVVENNNLNNNLLDKNNNKNKNIFNSLELDDNSDDIDNNKNIKNTYYVQAKKFEKNKQIDEAIKYYKLSLENDDNTIIHKSAFYIALNYEEELNDIDNAIKYYIISDKYGSEYACGNLALLYLDREEYNLAVPNFIKSISFYNFDILFHLIECINKLFIKYNIAEYNNLAMDLLVKYNQFVNSDIDIKNLFIDVLYPILDKKLNPNTLI
jgi:tetratricopeptide (TPR) repeat protein